MSAPMNYQHIPRRFVGPDLSYFLFGPRGTGKSTMMKRRYPNALLINLLLPNERRQYSTYPESLSEVVRALPDGHTIIIDEIQKVPQLLPLVHLLIEEKRNWQFILTGSSARKLKRTGVDLLGGRALKKSLHPFMAVELGEYFNLKKALQYGLLPLSFRHPEPAELLSTYVSLYLDEEVKAEGIVREIEPFTRFLEVLSFSHGSTINMSNIVRECGVKRTTGDNWLEIVKDLLIAFTIPVFTYRAKRHLVSQNKFYYFDCGVYRSLRPRSVLDSYSEISGGAIEGLVAQHLRAWIDYTKEKHALYYWRTKAGVEVDFILYGELGLWAIEVKNSQHIHPKDLRGLKHFSEDYPEAKKILVYCGERKLMKNDIFCIPCEMFLKNIIPGEGLSKI